MVSKKPYEGIRISNLELVLLNVCTPFDVLFEKSYGFVTKEKLSWSDYWEDVLERKLLDYQRLINDVQQNKGQLDRRVRSVYNDSLCGLIMIFTYYLRKLILGSE